MKSCVAVVRFDYDDERLSSFLLSQGGRVRSVFFYLFLYFVGPLSLICLCKWQFNASEEMRLNNIRITGRERRDPAWLGHRAKTNPRVCVGVCACVSVRECVMRAGELVYILSYDKCSLSYNLCASKYDVCEDEL